MKQGSEASKPQGHCVSGKPTPYITDQPFQTTVEKDSMQTGQVGIILSSSTTVLQRELEER